MGIWEKIKGFLGDNSKEGEEAGREEGSFEKTEITLGELKARVEERMKEDSERKEWLRKTLVEKIGGFEREINGVLKILKNYDLNKRKDQERLKLIVADNYYLYCSDVDRLLKELGKIKDMEFCEMTKKLSSSLKEFNEHSAKPYEKATILIGVEMANVRNVIVAFIRDMEAYERDNVTFFEKAALTDRINKMLLETEQNERNCREIEDAIERIRAEGERMNKAIEEKERKITEIKKSEGYRKDLAIKEERKKEIEELESRFWKIKERVDVKILARHFHFDERKNELVKKYADNFKRAAESDESLEIIEFVKSAQGIDIGELREIREKLKVLNDSLATGSERKIFGIESELEKIKLEISYGKSKIDAEMKRKEKLIGKREEIIKKMGDDAGKLFNAEIKEI